MVIGSDSPTLVLYDDGNVIYWKRAERGGKYVSAKLSTRERSEFLNRIDARAFESLESYYAPAANVTDQSEYLMVLRKSDGSLKGVLTYGSPGRQNISRTKSFPSVLTDIYEMVSGYEHPEAKEWLPDVIEVMIWPYEYAPDKNLAWPNDWPGLSDPKTIKRGDSYSIFIEKSRYEELKAFLSKRREKQAVLIGGKKWAISTRFPFPNESIWSDVRSKIIKELSRKPG